MFLEVKFSIYLHRRVFVMLILSWLCGCADGLDHPCRAYGINTPFLLCITKTHLFQYIEISSPKTENFQIKNSDIFHISAQNIDCGYSLEPPRRGGSNEYSQSTF